MFAALTVTGSAQVVVNPDTFPDFFTGDVNECYFASVSNGEDFGLGASQTSITVQNLDDEEGVAYILVGTGDGFDESTFAALQPGASKTFSAADLGVEEGETYPVAVLGYDFASSQAGEFTPEDGITLGCVAKQAVAGESLPYTTAADTSVSGYNATSGRETGFFDQLYLPIVQTNCGPGGCWNTILRVANVGPFDNAAVTVRFFPADNASGSLSTGFQLEGLLNQGELWSIDLSQWVPEGWVGSAHIFTDDAVVAIADRYKAGTDMWITNTAANATAESDLQVPGGPVNAPYVLYAPDVRMDFNGWNTGISVANTVDADNNVNIQYFGNNGNAPQAQSQRIAAHGMTYFYEPSNPSEDDCEQPADQVVTCDFVGAAIVLSEAPVAVAVDGVKYFGNDANVGQAFSYSATGNVFQFQAAPLVQKGSPATGMGATSGINFLNPNAAATFITVDWVNPSGFGASNFGDSIVWVPGFATGFVYTMTQANLPNGFSGSALVTSELPIAASSANVDYQVQGDGTAIWTLYNPCGFYRQLGDCVFVPAPEPLATKTFDIRPAGVDALICVFDSVTGQDGKPIAPDTDCVLESVFVKGGDGGGQEDVQTFVAGQFQLSVDDTDNTIEVDGLADDSTAQLGVLTELDVNGNIIASGDNATCADADAANLHLVTIGGQVSAEDFGLLSANFENTILIVDGECVDGIQAGTLRPETPEEAMERLGTVVPPFTVDANGEASVDLAAGCYFFVVSAEGFNTFTSIEECLESGETVDNIIDLVAIGGGGGEEGSLTKTFVDSAGNPVDELMVTVTDEAGNITEVGPVDNLGSFTIDPINFGTYELCWTDISDDTDLTQFIDGCETITVPDELGNEDVVVNNTLEMFAVLDVCVKDEESDAPLVGASVVALINDEIVASGVTGTDGEAELLVDADDATVVEVSASATGFTTSEGAVTISSEDPDEACGAADPGDPNADPPIPATDFNIGTADILLGLDSVDETQVVGVLKTVEFDGAAQEGLFVELAWITDGTTDCTVGTVVASGLTDANGQVELVDTEIAAPTGRDYCINIWTTDDVGAPVQLLMTDGPLDLSGVVGINPVTNDVAGTAAILDVVIDDSVAAQLGDVLLYTIAVYEADPINDTPTSCFGTQVSFEIGTEATFSTLVAAGDYCVQGEALVLVGGLLPAPLFGVGTGTVAAGDPAGDVDVTVPLVIFD